MAFTFFYEIHKQMDLMTMVMTNIEWIEETVRALDDLTKHLFIHN